MHELSWASTLGHYFTHFSINACKWTSLVYFQDRWVLWVQLHNYCDQESIRSSCALQCFKEIPNEILLKPNVWIDNVLCTRLHSIFCVIKIKREQDIPKTLPQQEFRRLFVLPDSKYDAALCCNFASHKDRFTFCHSFTYTSWMTQHSP